jgi:7-cyano-7-deazaguanine synthase
MSRVLVSFSGGADSITLLYRCIEEFGKENVQPMYFYYGQRHAPGEQEAVKAVCEKLDLTVKRFEFDLTQFGRSALTDPDIAVPAQSEKRQGITVVPYRNSFFILHAAAYAVTHDFDIIALGSTFEDLAEYPDCRPIFFEAMEKALLLGDNHHNLQLWAPYAASRKKDVIAEGLDLGVPYELSHTCYEGVYMKPCRVCDACKEREGSFLDNGITDPILLPV